MDEIRKHSGLPTLVLYEEVSQHSIPTAATMSPRLTLQTSRTWFRDGMMITNDPSMINFDLVESVLSSAKTIEHTDWEVRYPLVVLTPTPFGQESESQIGFLLFGVSKRRGGQSAVLYVDSRWQKNGLEEWLADCAKELKGEQGSLDIRTHSKWSGKWHISIMVVASSKTNICCSSIYITLISLPNFCSARTITSESHLQI